MGVIVSAAAALTAFYIVEDAREDSCSWEGNERGCWAGVVQAVEPAFSNAWDVAFPWNAMHDRVDVVVKSRFWPTLSVDKPPAVGTAECNEDADESPLVHCFYFSSEVCGAGLGGAIGAGVSVVPAVWAGVLVATTIGCSTFVFCLFALIAAALVAVAIVLYGAFLGAQAGKAIAKNDKPAFSSYPISPGDYVSLSGKISGEEGKGQDRHPQNPFLVYGGHPIMFFVEGTTMHGRSLMQKPYSYVDADTNFIEDACPVAMTDRPK